MLVIIICLCLCLMLSSVYNVLLYVLSVGFSSLFCLPHSENKFPFHHFAVSRAELSPICAQLVLTDAAERESGGFQEA